MHLADARHSGEHTCIRFAISKPRLQEWAWITGDDDHPVSGEIHDPEWPQQTRGGNDESFPTWAVPSLLFRKAGQGIPSPAGVGSSSSQRANMFPKVEGGLANALTRGALSDSPTLPSRTKHMIPSFNPRLSSAEHTSNFIDFQKSQSDRRRELQVVDKTNRFAQIVFEAWKCFSASNRFFTVA